MRLTALGVTRTPFSGVSGAAGCGSAGFWEWIRFECVHVRHDFHPSSLVALAYFAGVGGGSSATLFFFFQSPIAARMASSASTEQ